MRHWVFDCVLAAAIALASPLLASETPPVPDTNGWKKVNQSLLSVDFSDEAFVYLGFETDYKNPATGEFVRIMKRHLPLLVKHGELSARERAQTAFMASRLNQEEQNKLQQAIAESDAFAYLKWRVAKDERLGQEFQVGQAEIWLLSPSGEWTHAVGGGLKIEYLREFFGEKNIHGWMVVGQKYSVNGYYHILRAGHDDLAAAAAEKKKNKKSQKNEKKGRAK